MPVYDFDLVIIGGGAAGLTVAAGAAQLGVKTLLIEKENRLGGDCLHYGCVPSKTLIKIAKVYHLIKKAPSFGLPEVKVEPVDFTRVSNRIKEVIQIIQRHDSVERFCSLGVKVVFGEPRFVDEHKIKINGAYYSAKKFVIATGSSPSIADFEGLKSTGFITNKEIFYLDALPESMIVLGAGPIAIEMAQAFVRLGSDVVVVQRSNQILSREDKDMADLLMACLEAEGVRFYLNATVLIVSEKAGKKEVIIKHEGLEKSLITDEILVALGRKANLEGLGLDDIGIQYSEKGLVLDQRLRTTQKHIFGAGDVTGEYLFTHAAGYEGGIVIANAVFHLPKKVDYTLMPWCTYTDPEFVSIGLNEKRAKALDIDYTVWTEEFSDNDRALAEGTDKGRVKMLLNKKGRPIGIQIIGPSAGELIGEWIGALHGGVKLSTIASSVHPYPTLVEINKRIAGKVLSSKLFSDRVRKWLRFFFHFKGRACETNRED